MFPCREVRVGRDRALQWRDYLLWCEIFITNEPVKFMRLKESINMQTPGYEIWWSEFCDIILDILREIKEDLGLEWLKVGADSADTEEDFFAIEGKKETKKKFDRKKRLREAAWDRKKLGSDQLLWYRVEKLWTDHIIDCMIHIFIQVLVEDLNRRYTWIYTR